MLTKEQIIETIKLIPEEKFSNIENIIEEIILLEKVDKGMDDIKKGNVLSEDEANKEMDKW